MFTTSSFASQFGAGLLAFVVSATFILVSTSAVA